MAGEFRAFAAKGGIDIDAAQSQGGAFAQFSQRVTQRQIRRAQDSIYSASESLEKGTITPDAFKQKVENYRSVLGDDTTNSLIQNANDYAIQYPGHLFEASVQQYIPGDLSDWRGLTKEYAEQKIKEYEDRIAQEVKKREGKYHYYTEKELDQMTPAEQLAALNNEGIKGASDEAFDADSQIIQSLRAELDKYQKYESILSLQKETKAYESLSDENKRLIAQMAQIEAAGKKLKYEEDTGGTVMGITGVRSVTDSMISAVPALTATAVRIL